MMAGRMMRGRGGGGGLGVNYGRGHDCVGVEGWKVSVRVGVELRGGDG